MGWARKCSHRDDFSLLSLFFLASFLSGAAVVINTNGHGRPQVARLPGRHPPLGAIVPGVHTPRDFVYKCTCDGRAIGSRSTWLARCRP